MTKKKGCDACNGNKRLFTHEAMFVWDPCNYVIGISYKRALMTVTTQNVDMDDLPVHRDININYCPMCGRELGE